MAEEKYIQFISNYEDWVAIKKLKVEEKTDPRIVMEFLAGLGTAIDRKVESNLKKIVKLEKLDAVLKEEVKPGKSEANIAEVLAAVNGRKINAVIGEICDFNPDMQKNEKKELEDFCKVYAMRKALKECMLNVDYSGIAIPGMKKVMKAKV